MPRWLRKLFGQKFVVMRVNELGEYSLVNRFRTHNQAAAYASELNEEMMHFLTPPNVFYQYLPDIGIDELIKETAIKRRSCQNCTEGNTNQPFLVCACQPLPEK